MKPAKRGGVSYRRTALFTCGHSQDFVPPPRVGHKAWCKSCADYRHVKKLVEGWSVSCNGCRYSRFYGTAEWDAGKALGRHKAAHPNHTVSLFRNGALMKSLDNAEPLPGLGFGLDTDGEIIPF